MKKIIDGVKEEYKSKNRVVLITYLILNLLVIVFLIRGLIQGDIKDMLTCISTLILFLVPSIIHMKFKISFASLLEIMLYILAFSADILGEVLAFYIHIKIFDTILHILYGFIMAGIGFSLIEIFNNSPNTKMFLDPKYLVLFGFCFSMTTGAVWEIFEYSVDKYFKFDMQKDTVITEITSVVLNENGKNKAETIEIESLVVNDIDYIEKYGGYIDIGLNDTMKDLIVNLIGAIAYLVTAYSYIKGNGKSASKFMIKKSN